MASKRGQVKAGMKYREGDGAEMAIPEGPCEIEIGETDVTITWVDGEVRGATAIPLTDYHLRIKEGVLVVE